MLLDRPRFRPPASRPLSADARYGSDRLRRFAGSGEFVEPLCRFHTGLEERADLMVDLERAALRTFPD
jgi:hypothetical protein